MRYLYFIMVLTCLLNQAARADGPLPLPQKETTCNLNETFSVVSDPALDRITVINKKTNEAIWEMPGWQRWIYVSSDGKDILAYYGNLVGVDATAQQQVLQFFHVGKLTREVKIADLLNDFSVLRATTSHLEWGAVEGVTIDDRVNINLVDGELAP